MEIATVENVSEAGWRRDTGKVIAGIATATVNIFASVACQTGRLVLPGVLALSVALPADAATLYRYINDKGYQEIGYSVPNHLVPNGYDVIDESGRLVRRVAAQLSEEEYAAKLEHERQLEACQKAVTRVHRRYESLGDIDQAEAQFEVQLEESQQNAQANLEYNQSELGKHQDRAAGYERAGNIIPKNLLDSIEQSNLTIQNLMVQIQQGEQSRGSQALEFDEERRVFQLSGCNEEQLAHATPAGNL